MTNHEKVESYLEKIAHKNAVGKKIGVFMDFDECAIDNHLARLITDHYLAGRIDPEIEAAKADTSYKGIAKLFELYHNVPFDSFSNVAKMYASKVNWRPGFKEFWSKASQDEYVQLFWVSSGLSDAIKIMFSNYNLSLDDEAILADTLIIEQGIIKDSDMIIDEDEKSFVVEYFRKHGMFERIVTLGHSGGDRHLVASGDSGYRLAFRDKGSLVGVADHIIENWDWMKVLDFLN